MLLFLADSSMPDPAHGGLPVWSTWWWVMAVVAIVLPVLAVYLIGMSRATHSDGDHWHLGIDFGVTLIVVSVAFGFDLFKKILREPDPVARSSIVYLLVIFIFIFLGVLLLVGSILSESLIIRRRKHWGHLNQQEPGVLWGCTWTTFCVFGCNLIGTLLLALFLSIVFYAG